MTPVPSKNICHLSAYLTNRCVNHPLVAKLFPQSLAYLSRYTYTNMNMDVVS